MPRQLLPSVFGGNVYPHGLRCTLKLLTCPTDTDKWHCDCKRFCVLFIDILLKWPYANGCTGVYICIGVYCCRPELVKKSHTCKVLLHDVVASLCCALLQSHLSFFPWRWTDCEPEPVPTFSCYHSHYILQEYSIAVTSFMLHIHQFVKIVPDFLSNDPKSSYTQWKTKTIVMPCLQWS